MAKAATDVKERYLLKCHERNIEPHSNVFAALQNSAKEYLLNITNDFRIDLAGNNGLSNKKRLNDLDVDVVCDVLVSSTALLSLDLRYNNLTDKAAKGIAKLIADSNSLEELNLMCNDLTDVGAEYIARAVALSTTLKYLNLNCNRIGGKGGMDFAEVLKTSCTLVEIDLGNCDLNMESIIAICSILHENSVLESINLNRPIVFTSQEELAVHLGKMLIFNYTLRHLHLEKHKMGNFGIERLCDALLLNKTLKYLNVSSNRISRDGALAISKMLEVNYTLKMLDLGNNRIDSPGAIFISEALRVVNRGLTTLSLINNRIGNEGLLAVAGAIEINEKITNIYVWGNEFGPDSYEAFGKLVRSKRLKTKNTDFKPYMVDGKTYLAQLSHGINHYYYWQPYYGLDYDDNSDEDDNERFQSNSTQLLKNDC